MAARSSLNAEQSSSPLQFPMDNNNHGIGVALGSPRLALVPGQDPSMVPRTMTTITSPAATVTEQQQQQQQQQQQSKATGLSRSISKRLPFLGRSKSKRINSNNGGTNYSRPCADPSRANYISGTPSTPAPSPSVPMASSASANRARPDAAKLKKQKPLGARSLTDPQMQPQSGDKQQTLAWTPGQPGLMLDVEIPDISFERYSVMFESLIEKQQQSASNLLARRQATLARIKASDDSRREHSSELQRSRRATSPSATPIRTPIAQPSAEDSASDINIVPLRLRSNTFPMIASQSPRAPSPEDQTDSPGASLLSPDSQFSLVPDGEGRRLLHSKFHKPSVESIHSPYFRHTTERETATALSPPPCSSRRLPDGGGGGGGGSSSNVATPVYTMMPPAKQIDIPCRSTSLRNSRKLPAAAAAAAPKPKPNPKPASVEEALEDAAEVSIARQISISRGQRRFLEPLHERERRRARANQHIKAASQISLDDGKRISETKTATPTVIHPDHEQAGESSASPRQHMYRRSEQVTIEGA